MIESRCASVKSYCCVVLLSLTQKSFRDTQLLRIWCIMWGGTAPRTFQSDSSNNKLRLLRLTGWDVCWGLCCDVARCCSSKKWAAAYSVKFRWERHKVSRAAFFTMHLFNYDDAAAFSSNGIPHEVGVTMMWWCNAITKRVHGVRPSSYKTSQARKPRQEAVRRCFSVQRTVPDTGSRVVLFADERKSSPRYLGTRYFQINRVAIMMYSDIID